MDVTIKVALVRLQLIWCRLLVQVVLDSIISRVWTGIQVIIITVEIADTRNIRNIYVVSGCMREMRHIRIVMTSSHILSLIVMTMRRPCVGFQCPLISNCIPVELVNLVGMLFCKENINDLLPERLCCYSSDMSK